MNRERIIQMLMDGKDVTWYGGDEDEGAKGMQMTYGYGGELNICMHIWVQYQHLSNMREEENKLKRKAKEIVCDLT